MQSYHYYYHHLAGHSAPLTNSPFLHGPLRVASLPTSAVVQSFPKHQQDEIEILVSLTAPYRLLNNSSEPEQNFVSFTFLLPRKTLSSNRGTGKRVLHWVKFRRFSSHYKGQKCNVFIIEV